MKKKWRFPFLLLFFCVAPLRAELAVWSQSYLKPMIKEDAAPSQLEKTISIKVTPGEYEPAAFAVRADSPVPVTVELKEACYLGRIGLFFKAESALKSTWCELSKVVSLNESTQPNRLYEFEGPVSLAADRTQFFWLTVRPSAGTPPGLYRGCVKVKSGSLTEELEIECEVLPFKLEDSPVTGGVFMASTNIPPSWYSDMKEHGLDAIQFFWGSTGIEISRQDDRIVLDFAGMDDYMAGVMQSGMRGPVIISLGNDNSLHYERRIAAAFDLPVVTGPMIGGKAATGPEVTPQLDSLFVEGLRQIRGHWEGKAYPQELVVLIYDEPTERLLERCKSRYDLLKIAMPNTRVYGVVMNRRAWAESMLDQCDIIVSDGGFLDCMEVAQQNGKDYWVYSFPLSAVHTSRYDMGCMPWRVEAQGAFFWMYNYWGYDPNGCAVYRDPDNQDRLIRSTPWEGVREGMDDLRYFATAEKLVQRSRGQAREAADKRLAEVKNSIDPNRRRPAPRGEANDELSVLKHYSEPQRVRDEVIKIILDLL